ncbi:hypothetical protein HPB48_005723 [Haemaphysalis longicornis]|uniref:DDE Tnp4 domain-containing protein n=1 Tax=Haemaphysalis longicornis TaxID=44386 RepID=A0A9J6FBY0_HAELO|nr:hypothetical protein HPB48_005723 [Haemaphysalis longicornis]
MPPVFFSWKKIFNNYHSQQRVAIENCFGLLKQRFRRLYLVDAKTIMQCCHIIMGACVLHNLCNSERDFIEELADLPAHDDVGNDEEPISESDASAAQCQTRRRHSPASMLNNMQIIGRNCDRILLFASAAHAKAHCDHLFASTADTRRSRRRIFSSCCFCFVAIASYITLIRLTIVIFLCRLPPLLCAVASLLRGGGASSAGASSSPASSTGSFSGSMLSPSLLLSKK